MIPVGGPWLGSQDPSKARLQPIDEEQYLELIRLVVAHGKRLEAIEKRVGIIKEQPAPCSLCNVLNSHQPWCEKNVDRV